MSRVLTILGILVTLAMVASAAIGVSRVGAQTTVANYSVTDHSVPNRYTGECGFWVTLDSLTSTYDYTFRLTMVDAASGQPTSTLATQHFTGATTDDVIFGPDCRVGPQPRTDWVPYSTYGPVAIVDEWGHVVFRGFLAPERGQSWLGDQAVSDHYRVGIGQLTDLAPNDDGYFHPGQHQATGWPESPMRVTTVRGDKATAWTLMHWGATSGYAATEYIEISNVETATVLATFAMDDLVAYSGINYSGFVVLSTDGTCPVFVDCGYAADTFVTEDNPTTLTVPIGAYDYARMDTGPSVLGEGESIWLVTDHSPTLDRPNEWSVLLERSAVISGDPVYVNIYARTTELWTAFPLQSVTDTQQGLVNDNDYPFRTSRRISFTSSSTPVAVSTVTYRREAAALNYGQDPADFGFEILSQYTFRDYYTGWATLAPTPKPHTSIVQSVTNIPSDMGWGDGILTVIYIVLCIGAWALLALGFHYYEPGGYIMVYELITIGCLLAGWWDVWAKIVIGVLAVAIFLAWMLGLGRGQESSPT